MSIVKTVHFEEMKNTMEQMLQAPIFRISEKRRMLRDESENVLDPNLIMDARHKIFQEPLPISPSNNSIFTEAKRYQVCDIFRKSIGENRLLLDEETTALYQKRERELLENQLKKFQKQLYDSRPKFRGPYACSRKVLADSDNEQFWRIVSRKCETKNAVKSVESVVEESEKRPEGEIEKNESNENVYPGNIRVTIRGKPMAESKEQTLQILKTSFEALMHNAKERRRLRDVKMKIQERMAGRKLRRFFDAWRTYVKNVKRLAQKRKEERNMSDERKIELFVNAIIEKQREMTKKEKSTVKETVLRVRSPAKNDEATKKPAGKPYIGIESPAQNRLKAQKKIITEQRLKLAEQNKIIEEMRLKEIENDTRKAKTETTDAAKEVLVHCGRRTRRTLIQLMREEGYRDKALVEPPRLLDPPKFLVRMEARAEARRERVRRAEEARQKRLEEQKRKEKAARKEEEEKRRRLQQDAQREARRLREEQEQRRAREAERNRSLNEMADKFYRMYLLRHYIMEPFTMLVDMKHNLVEIAQDHYKMTILQRTFTSWKMETQHQYRIKLELAITVYNRNLMWYVFRNWREFAKSEVQRYQVASDFYDMQLQNRYLKTWCTRTLESKVQRLENEQMVREYYEKRLRVKYFNKWKRYPKIAKEVEETERRKDKWRELVQKVVPDFDPKQRGVAIED